MCTIFRSKSKGDAISDQLFGFVPKVWQQCQVSMIINCYYCLSDTMTGGGGFAILPPSRQVQHMDGNVYTKITLPSFLQHFHSPFTSWSLTMQANVSVLRFTSLVVPVKGAWRLQLHTVSKARQREMRKWLCVQTFFSFHPIFCSCWLEIDIVKLRRTQVILFQNRISWCCSFPNSNSQSKHTQIFKCGQINSDRDK